LFVSQDKPDAEWRSQETGCNVYPFGQGIDPLGFLNNRTKRTFNLMIQSMSTLNTSGYPQGFIYLILIVHTLLCWKERLTWKPDTAQKGKIMEAALPLHDPFPNILAVGCRQKL
jgi:hypothetical protein